MAVLPLPKPYRFDVSTERYRAFGIDLANLWVEGGLHRVFDRAIDDLEGLLRKSRSLIVIDWKFNREIHAVIREYMTGMAGKESVKRRA